MTPLALACWTGLATASGVAIDPSVLAAVDHGGETEVLITLPERSSPLLLDPNLDYAARRRVWVAMLQSNAQQSQAELTAWLREHGVSHRSFWITNVVAARVDASSLQALARRKDVLRIHSDMPFVNRLEQPIAATEVLAVPFATTWGLDKIRAPMVWAAGVNGAGVVVAGEDTGYRWDHPALKAKYRGWDGIAVNHNYSWFDAIHTGGSVACPSSSPAACDGANHGTHTMGTMVGDDGGTNQIGVAPGARWIGCRNMNASGLGTPTTYMNCIQWMLAPTDVAGLNPDPDRAPDVVNNSWGCPPSEGCTTGQEFAQAVNNLVAGGVVFVASAGNGTAPDSCNSIVMPPAIFDASIVVGATDSTDRLAGLSLRGPVAGSSLVRPDLSAPGVAVLSSVPPAGYANMGGTSMAGPHVAGVVALMMAANPALKGDPARVAQILRQTAITSGVSNTSGVTQSCGGTPITTWPNNMVGYGRLDAWNAFRVAETIFVDGLGD